jgi:hypothetical protein
VASLGYRLSDRSAVALGAGAVLTGRLEGEGRGYDILPGPLFAVSGAYRALGRPSSGPFLALTLGIGASFARTRADADGTREHLTAFDARVGVEAGYLLFHRLSPYLAARGFGGPVLWRELGADRTGTDVHHYAIGLGVSLALTPWFAVRAEGIPLGERTLSAGATLLL